MNVLVKILILIAFSILGLAGAYILGCPIIDQEEAQALPAIAISSGVLIASLAYLRDKDKNDMEADLKHDELQLQIAKEGLCEVYELLSDLNNTRVVWIRAARVLLNTLEIGKSIRTKQFNTAFDISKEDLRSKLYLLFQIEPEDNAAYDKESLPPQFFYGVENWKDRSLTIDQAAILSKSKIEAHRVTLDKVTPEPKLSELDNRSIVAIYDFTLSIDESFNDPLSTVNVWQGDLSHLHGIKQGPGKYLEHKSRYFVVNGELRDKNQG